MITKRDVDKIINEVLQMTENYTDDSDTADVTKEEADEDNKKIRED